VLDVRVVRAYQDRFPDLLRYGTNKECRELVRCFVDSIELRPDAPEAEQQNEPVAHEIAINFRAMPAQFVKGLGAGACFESHNKLLFGATVAVLPLYFAGARNRPPRLVRHV